MYCITIQSSQPELVSKNKYFIRDQLHCTRTCDPKNGRIQEARMSFSEWCWCFFRYHEWPERLKKPSVLTWYSSVLEVASWQETPPPPHPRTASLRNWQTEERHGGRAGVQFQKYRKENSFFSQISNCWLVVINNGTFPMQISVSWQKYSYDESEGDF